MDFNGDKKRMRELLTQIAEEGFAPLSDIKDPAAAFISKHDVGGVVQRGQAMVIGLPGHVWGENTIGLVASVQSVRLVIARVLHKNPEVLADNAKIDNTGVVYDLEKYRAIDQQLIGLTAKIEEVESDIKVSSDPDERMRLGEEEEQLRTEKKQFRKEKERLREEEIILFSRQDGSINYSVLSHMLL